ncbi:hypothetical protein BKA64DRAFT_736631 [Cadophora sp. MPI-SDFR-AT-0126]|nr:hypothetical protein BKA64DRAFT_736631 [Leotiomycetes sp. MPI-SDFR-AT-0126]
MDAITQHIVNNSQLEVSLIKISDATPDTFKMSIESRVTNTGPISSTISPMTVDLVGSVIKTSSSGADVHVPAQVIKITDKAAFKAFVTAVLRDESLVLQLKNGKGTVKALLGLSAEIDYNKDVPLKGMNGPKTSIAKTVVDGGGFKNTLTYVNPSPLELDLGIIKQELRNKDGSVIAVQQGKTYLVRGETNVVVEGKVVGKAAGGEAVIVSVGVVEDNWHNETITAFQEPVILSEELLSLSA